MISFYHRLMRGCHTINQQNKLRITLENRMTPLELDVLRSELPPAPMTLQHLFGKGVKELRRKFPGMFKTWHQGFEVTLSAHKWVEQLDPIYSLSGKPRPEPFVRRKLRSPLTFFEARGDKTHKILAICFGGNAQRMMMPMPVFLQHLNADRVDVAFLTDPRRNSFRRGVDGIAPNMEFLINELKTLLRIEEYQGVVAIGTSSGGTPAILTAVKLGLDAGLSVGGNGPDDPGWLMDDGKETGDLLSQYSKQSSVEPKLFLAFGSDIPKDRLAAEALSSIVPSTLIPISNPSGPVGHNALYSLLIQGKLVEFLETTVFDFSRGTFIKNN